MPAMVAMSSMTSTSDSTSGIDVARRSAYPVDCRRSTPFDYDTYLLSASPPGFEFSAARYRQYSPLTSSPSFGAQMGSAALPPPERYRRRFYQSPSMAVKDTAAETTTANVAARSSRHSGSNSSSSTSSNDSHTNNGSISPLNDVEEQVMTSSIKLSSAQAKMNGSTRCTCCGTTLRDGIRKTNSLSELRRKVSFADDVGKQLELVRIFTESPDTPPNIDRNIISRHEKLAEIDSACRLKLVPDFSMPRDNRAGLVDRVNRNLVSLESIRVVTDGKSSTTEVDSFDGTRVESTTGHQLVGTVIVKNVSFEKSVFIRYTFNDWSSSHDVTAAFIRSQFMTIGDRRAFGFGASSSLTTCVDVFQFQVDVPTSTDDHMAFKLTAQFALCFEHPGVSDVEKNWDNNDGANYCLQLLPKQVEDVEKRGSVRKSTEPTCGTNGSCSMENNSWQTDKESGPYW